MTNTSINMSANTNVNDKLIDNKDLRDNHIDRIEILDKVKAIFMIPEMEVLTTKMIADYYEVSIATVKTIYDRNKLEINSDGTKVYKSSKQFLGFHNEATRITQKNGKKLIEFSNGLVIDVPNANIRVYTKRACLRFGMLLRDSKIAKEIRTQLLNVFETTTDTQRTMHIDEESMLIMNYGKAMLEKNIDMIRDSVADLNMYHRRNTSRLEAAVYDLETENELLSRSIAKWGDREICNRLVRYMSHHCFIEGDKKYFGVWWNSVYAALQYKYGINLKARKGKGSHLNKATDDEMPKVVQLIASIAKGKGVDLAKVINEINAEDVEIKCNQAPHC